jgi:hypothetical protein
MKSKGLPDYLYMRAWCRFVGYPSSLIRSQVDRARQLGAPQDVLEENGAGQWLRLSDLRSPTARDYLETVVGMIERNALKSTARGSARSAANRLAA